MPAVALAGRRCWLPDFAGQLACHRVACYFCETSFQLIHRIVERLDLARELIHLAAVIALQLLQTGLESSDGRRYLVHAVGVLVHQVLHDAHAFIERLLHVSHLVLQGLHLRLQLNHLLADAPSCGYGQREA